MCFSNLPLEFDDEGNPYLAEEADDVERPDGVVHADDCDCDTEVTAADLTADPEGAYEAIVADLPDGAREHLDEGESDRRAEPEAAGGD